MQKREILGIESEGLDGWHATLDQIRSLKASGYEGDRDPGLIKAARALVKESDRAQVGRVQSGEVVGGNTIVRLLGGDKVTVMGEHTLFDAASILCREVVSNTVTVPKSWRR